MATDESGNEIPDTAPQRHLREVVDDIDRAKDQFTALLDAAKAAHQAAEDKRTELRNLDTEFRAALSNFESGVQGAVSAS